MEELVFASDHVEWPKEQKSVSLEDIGTKSMCGNGCALEVTESNYVSDITAAIHGRMAVEIELDKETGHVEILDYKAVVDCGTVVNPNLARVQAEGGIVQGIGMTLYENIQYNEKGRMLNNSFMQYKSTIQKRYGKSAGRI